MPASIINGILTTLSAEIEAEVWDGEVPRYDTEGNPIEPLSTVTEPTNWPVLTCFMRESGFKRDYTFETAYSDTGAITIQVWGTSRLSVENTLNSIETLFTESSVWSVIDIGGPPAAPYFIYRMAITRWSSIQEIGDRTQTGLFVYRGELDYDVWIHGSLSR